MLLSLPRTSENPLVYWGFSGGRYWDRTSDLCRVKADRASCDHWRFGQNPIQDKDFPSHPLWSFSVVLDCLTDT